MSIFEKPLGQTDELKKRLLIFSLIPISSFLMIISVLFVLQIVRGPAYELKAKTNREQFAILPTVRGIIYDRTGEQVFAINKRSFVVYIVPQNLPSDKKEREKIIEKLSILLKMQKDDIKKIFNNPEYVRYVSYVLKTDVPFEDVVFLAEHNRDFPGVYWKSKPIRVYPDGETAAHVIGYVGMINEKELQENIDRGYNLESVLGKSGIERVYDLELRGRDGYIRRIVDATNQVIAETIDQGTEPIPGNNVILTLDKRIQKIAEQALGERPGAVVVSKSSTGEILALVSYPRYDPNLFVSQGDQETFRKLTLDRRKPFLNRAVQAQYPAGSIFKLVVAMALLDTGKISTDREYICGGGYRLGNRFFSCWKNHGKVNLYKAIVESCDSYFYQVSLALGPDTIARYAQKLRLGQLTGIDLLGEAEGIVPHPMWKIENKKEIWFDGDTLNMAIGQGYVLVTPLQVNILTNIIANRGKAFKPYLVKEIISARSGEVVYRKTPDVLVNSSIDHAYFDFIADAMRGVVSEGTARWGGAVLSTEMAGKTSSAEIMGADTHSWFTAFAPSNTDDKDSVISVTVIIEHGGAGSESAAPVASEIVESIFGNCDLETARKNIWKKRVQISKKLKAIEENLQKEIQDESGSLNINKESDGEIKDN